MKKALINIGTLLLLSSMAFVSVGQSRQLLDRVSVIVNQGVILESEIAELVRTVKATAATSGQSLPSDRALRTQAIERLILENLQSQTAERMGIQISDPQLDQTIASMAASEGFTPQQFRNLVVADGISYESYRESVRQELIMGEVRRANVRRRVYITPQEIATLVDLLDQQGDSQAEWRHGLDEYQFYAYTVC